jgi:hypothetical protein
MTGLLDGPRQVGADRDRSGAGRMLWSPLNRVNIMWLMAMPEALIWIALVIVAVALLA